jgi:two-component system NtrC family response regulator
MARILIVDDDHIVCQSIASVVERMGHEPYMVSTLKEATTRAHSEPFDLVYLDVRMPDGNGLDVLPKLKEASGSPEVIIMTGYGDPDGAELAIKNGAWDYIEKPASVQSMSLPLTRALEYRDKKQSNRAPVALKRDRIVGQSPQMQACLDQVAQAAASEADVLINGETGTGKEVFALAIHENSPRARGNFVVVDCAALPETLVESVLFGHEKGAFTGASHSREGLIRQADGGTLFLDEVGELPMSIQKTFLRVLQERRFRSVGGHREAQSDFRLVAATNQDIDAMVRQSKFREDLLFRLQGFKIELPALRDRRDDIKHLAVHYVSELCERYRMPTKGFSPDFTDELLRYDWPGNVRELIQALEKAIATAQDDPVLFPTHLPTHIRVRVKRAAVGETKPQPQEASAASQAAEPDLAMLDLDSLPPLKKVRAEAVAKVERQYLQKLMGSTGGDVKQAIRISGLSRSRLYTLLKKYGVSTG